MNEKLKAILDKIQAKSTDRDNILSKDGFGADDVDKVKNLNGEISALQEQYQLVEQAEAQKSFLDAPANRLPMPVAGGANGGGSNGGGSNGGGSNGGGSTKDVEILGYAPAGHAELEFDRFGRLESLKQTGPGVFGEKVWNQINTGAYKLAHQKYLRKGERGLSSAELKDMELGIDPQGGYLVAPEMLNRIISRMATPRRVAGLCTNLTTSKDALVVPKVNYKDANEVYSTGFRVTYTGETAETEEARVNTEKLFGGQRIEVFTVMMTTLMPRDFVDDVGMDIQGWVSEKLQETADIEGDRTVISGTGIGQPLGLLTAIGTEDSPRIVKTGDANTIKPDGLIDLAYSIPEQYIDNLRYLMNRTNTAREIRKLKDNGGRYLFGAGDQNNGLANEREALLVGYPGVYSGLMPNIAANAYPILFGDYRGYYRVMRLGLSVQVILEKYAENNKVGLVARMRHGGKPVEPWRIAAHQVAA